jgi:hypothetical protein
VAKRPPRGWLLFIAALLLGACDTASYEGCIKACGPFGVEIFQPYSICMCGHLDAGTWMRGRSDAACADERTRSDE